MLKTPVLNSVKITYSSDLEGDFNNDNKVNSQDFALILPKWLQTQNIHNEDLNNDNRVDVRDLGIMMSSWEE